MDLVIVNSGRPSRHTLRKKSKSSAIKKDLKEKVKYFRQNEINNAMSKECSKFDSSISRGIIDLNDGNNSERQRGSSR